MTAIGAPRERAPKLPRAFWALWVCQLVNRLGSFVQPFLVLYLTQDRHLSPGTAGAVAAAVGAGSVVSQLVGGWLSDRIGRRRTMLIGFLGTAAALILLGSAGSLEMIAVTAFTVGLLGDLFRPAVQATVADLLDPRERVRAYGLLFWAINLGFSVSTVSAGVLASVGYSLLFWINAATSVVAALVIWRMVPETRPVLDEGPRRSLLPVALRDTTFVLMILIQIGYATIYFQGYSTLPLAMAADGLPSATYGLVIALNGVVIVVVQPFVGRRLAAFDRPRLLAGSMLLVGLGFGIGAVVHSWWGYGLSVVVWTIGEIGFAAVIGAVFADLAPVDLRGGYLGLAGSMSFGLGSVIGPLIGTNALEHLGATATWLACAVLGVVLFLAQLGMSPALHARANAAGERDPDFRRVEA
ncbi:major facilitator superfamily MFS_1 [Kribbella flavida DSM 17836]|uniref:Major facilitator superfamily MFS_1 n=1 Tax=Kribbella flavida (strain DSM 17836 / JCM 10339 / NBRC 14399) TaxID=479435 RepID=D2PV74_KRIFD|nr:MFS transporter [Kribbella flavida]ADB33355.1 major facilitator superfamily MFS_1 [Kribbella flavida DSM 17836]